MLVGLLVIVLITVRTVFVPVWEEDAQASHMRTVNNQMAQIKADADRQMDASSPGAVTNPLQMGRQTTGFFDVPDLPDQVSFEPGTTRVRVNTSLFRLFLENGTDSGNADEDWIDITTDDRIGNISGMEHFRLRIDSVGDLHADGENILITLRDADGDFAGDFRAMQRRDPPDNYLEIRTRNKDKDVIVDQPVSFFGTQEVSPYWVWVNDAQYLFDRVLARAEKPASIELTENGLTGAYTITYLVSDSGGSAIVGSGGTPIEDFNRTYRGGSFTYTGLNSHYVNQELTLENGALVLEQPEGAAFRISPQYGVSVVQGRVVLSLSVPSLVGDRFTLSGGGSATVVAKADQRQSLVGTAPKFTYNVTTSHPSLYIQHWRQEIREAGLSASAGHFATSSGSDWAKVTVFGFITDPASTETDVTVNLRQASVGLQIKS